MVTILHPKTSQYLLLSVQIQHLMGQWQGTGFYY